MFPGYRETTLSEGRSRFCGQEIRKAESVEAVCELYRAEWARFENAAEEKRRAKEEEVHRLRMEGRAQRQPEVGEERRQREEAERKANEAERKANEAERRADEERREHEAELSRIRARMAELERRAV
ncbi:hypothetical protein P692DRAFT_20883920 [Suillus brevipes Sb2]|nr:hypothetical protein P692DRAFT_20883920 [Suillus brevipes Sb2]